MNDYDILSILKMDLQISALEYDDYLENLIELANSAIEKDCIKIEHSTVDDACCFSKEDGMLIQMYAAYLYRKRREENAAMPRMLRYALNNRLFSQKGRQ